MVKWSWRSYLLYCGRWQMSTPLLAGVLFLLGGMNPLWATIIANLIGGASFFFIDRLIFRRQKKNEPSWEIREKTLCHDCTTLGTGFRIVEWGRYDRLDAEPEWRCLGCALKKKKEVQEKI